MDYVDAGLKLLVVSDVLQLVLELFLVITLFEELDQAVGVLLLLIVFAFLFLVIIFDSSKVLRHVGLLVHLLLALVNAVVEKFSWDLVELFH